MTERLLLAALVAASAGALAVALFVQYGLGYPPCALCQQARIPHVVVLVVGPLALLFGRPRLGLTAVTAALLAAFAISLRHVGVEHGWLALPGGCQVPDTLNDVSSLRTAMLAQTQPTCDQPGPRLFGVSMPQWHALAALALAAVATAGLSRGVAPTSSPPRRSG